MVQSQKRGTLIKQISANRSPTMLPVLARRHVPSRRNRTGTEDYFNASYGFPEIFSSPYSGCTLKRTGKDGPPKWRLYRWHIMDPISFQKDLRVNIHAL